MKKLILTLSCIVVIWTFVSPKPVLSDEDCCEDLATYKWYYVHTLSQLVDLQAEHEALETEHQILQDDYDSIFEDHQQLQIDYQDLEDDYNDALGQIADYQYLQYYLLIRTCQCEQDVDCYSTEPNYYPCDTCMAYNFLIQYTLLEYPCELP